MAPAGDAWDDWESADYSRSSSNGYNAQASVNSNARIWQVANSSLSFGAQTSQSASPYGYVGSSSSGAGIPPPQAYMPSLKILKRPTGSSSRSSSPNSSNASGQKSEKQSLQARERAYQEARTRIFGESSNENSESEERKQPASAVARSDVQKTSSSSSLAKTASAQGKKGSDGVTIIREPINPPSKGSSKGFNTKRRQKPLSAAAVEFKPSFSVPSPTLPSPSASTEPTSPASSTASISLSTQLAAVSVRDT